MIYMRKLANFEEMSEDDDDYDGDESDKHL